MAAPHPLFVDGGALADAAWAIRAGLGDRRSSFEVRVGTLPRHHGFCVVAGVESCLERLARSGEWGLAEIPRGVDAEVALRLGRAPLRVNVDAVADGALAFGGEPLVTVEGPLVQALAVAALARSLLALATTTATRAARLVLAAGGGEVIDGSSLTELGWNAARAAARAAHVGGCSAVASPALALALGIPLRAAPRPDLAGQVPPTGEDGWESSPEDTPVDLGLDDDEEATLVESRRVGVRAAAWTARGLTRGAPLPLTEELVAIEQDGAWKPRRGLSGQARVTPGKKLLVRYLDAAGRACADVVHLAAERIEPPSSMNAHAFVPLSRARMRDGRTLEATEPCAEGRERALAGMRAFDPAVLHLRLPRPYPVRRSPGLDALRAEPAQG